MPRTHLAALAATLIVLLGAAAPAASADSGDIGYQDQDFTGFSSSVSPGPSGTKPESKLWFNDGSWWAVMYEKVSDDFHIFKLDGATQQWSDTGVAVDDRDNTLADALSVGSTLYIASHVMKEDSTGIAGNPSRLYRYTYSGGTYSLDTGFPVNINDTSSESLVIDRDSAGELWATWTGLNGSSQPVVWVASSSCAATCVWSAPVQLSTNVIAADDISSLVAFGGKIGVMWSDQAADATMWFAVHDSSGWAAPEAAISGTSLADDHINLKADASGRVFAATKTALGGTAVVQLLVRTAAGLWVKHPFGDVGGGSSSLTRAIVVLDSTTAHVFMTKPDTGGTIVEKTLPISSADTDGTTPGASVERIKDADALKMNNATSTKQVVTSGLVVLATNKKTDVTPNIRNYWHYSSSAVVDVTPPVLASAGIVGSKLTLTYGEPLDSGSVPAASAYVVKVNSVPVTVNVLSVSGSLVRLSMLAPVVSGDVVTIGYTPGAAPVQDLAGNDAAPLTNQAVANTTAAGTAFDLIPTGDSTFSLVTTNSGLTTNFFAAIDDGIATPDDDTTYVHNNATAAGGQDGSLVVTLTDMPSNFTAMSTLKIDVRARMIARVDDDTLLYAQIVKADGTTPLSAEALVATNPGPTNWATISNLAFTGLVAGTKADWDGAKLKLRWDWVQKGSGPDNGNRLRVTATELHATYSTSGGQGPAPGYLRAYTTPAGAVPGNILLTAAGGGTLIWRNQWATDWMKLDPGVYTIAATAVEGFVPPSPQQVTITSGNTTTVDLHYQTLGNLHVILSPAVAGTITIDGDRVNDGGFFSPYPAGSHQVCFGAVAGFDPPPCQTVNVAANRASVTTVTGTYTANAAAPGETGVGYLRVALQPAGQVPALIYIDGKLRNQWALDWLKLPPGNYTISYSDVEGFRAPSPQQVTIVAGQVTTLTPQFETLGNLRVRTNPSVSGTITVDGVPINDWSAWTPFAAGQHQVCFGAVPGYVAPPCQTVNIAADRTKLTDITGTYVPS